MEATCVKRVAYFRMSVPALKPAAGQQQQGDEATCLAQTQAQIPTQARLALSQLDGGLCTHLILASVRINSQGNLALMAGQESEQGAQLAQVKEFKRRHPGVKVLVSVANELTENGFAKAAGQTEIRHRLARSAMDFLEHYHLDGLDLDWEPRSNSNSSHPATSGNASSFGSLIPLPAGLIGRDRDHERLGLTKIVKSLREVIVENFYARQVNEQHKLPGYQDQVVYSGQAASAAPGVEPYLLTVSVSGQEAPLRSSYELKQVANLCDWLNVKSFDYFPFKAYAPFTGPNSPLQPLVEAYVPYLSKLALAWTVNRLLEEPVPREKLVMGVPTYGRAYRLLFKNSQPSAFTLALGIRAGQIEADCMHYREVCDLLKRPDTVVGFDERARVPYLLTHDGATWVSYENEQSVREKVRHIIEQKLAGYMTWNLNCDFFEGFEKGSRSSFPLHSAMLDEVIAFEGCKSIAAGSEQSQRQQRTPNSNGIQLFGGGGKY